VQYLYLKLFLVSVTDNIEGERKTLK